MSTITGDHGHGVGVNNPFQLRNNWSPDSSLLRSMDVRNLMTWIAPCLVCGKILRNGAGLFCGNFLRSRPGFPQCLAAWCGTCYHAHPDDPFPVQKSLEDEEEDLETEENLDTRYKVARNGDHLMGIPFECDLCHFRNVSGRDPIPSRPGDVMALICTRRANLDACWSRETSTVAGNLNRMRRDYRDAVPYLPIREPLPPLGVNVVEDRVGMRVVWMSLMASLRKGNYADHLQWDSVRKTPTWFNNIWDAGSNHIGTSMFTSFDKKVFETTSPTQSKWFSRWLLGAKRRMGVLRIQDEALTAAQLKGLCDMAEEDHQCSKCEAEKKDIESLMAFTLIGFCISLRGEEVPLTSIDGLATYWEETRAHATPHMMITLRGKFKGENNLRWHCVPLAVENKSNLPTRRWISRMLHRRYRREGHRSGYLFAKKNGRKSSLGDYDPLFREYLSRLQKRKPKLFCKDVVINEYSLRRSLRRGATTEAENNGVDLVTIELINRWRRKEKARGAEAGLSMRQTYTQVSRAVVAALRFSQSH